MYKVKKPKKGEGVSIEDRRKLNSLFGSGLYNPEDVLNPTPAQMKVLLELGVDMTDVVVAGGVCDD